VHSRLASTDPERRILTVILGECGLTYVVAGEVSYSYRLGERRKRLAGIYRARWSNRLNASRTADMYARVAELMSDRVSYRVGRPAMQTDTNVELCGQPQLVPVARCNQIAQVQGESARGSDVIEYEVKPVAPSIAHNWRPICVGQQIGNPP
jgi:hypothetical protein